ncbi:MAG: hypothetical protein PHI85_05965 [Victivallaceae bacterium]|nr:hypothetical protein [Victivallaceae bacterium]
MAQITIYKEIPLQKRHRRREVPSRLRQKLQILCQQNGDKRCPNLNLDRVFTGSDERFDLEIRFEHLEKAFDLSTEFIDVVNGFGTKIKVIRQQNQRPVIHYIADNHSVASRLYNFRLKTNSWFGATVLQ